MSKGFFRLAAAALLLAVAPAMAGDFQAPADGANNPPPKEAFSAFQRFEAQPISMGAPWAGQKGNEAAKDMLQADLDERLKPLLAEWNAKPAGDGPRTLRVEPVVRYIRYITGGKRFWGGGFAGNSAVMVSLKVTDSATGDVIAEPDFYQHANGLGAAYSFGATDKTMLIRISNMITEYMRANYPQAVGGSISIAPDIDN
jgi:hypothetical protein